MFQVRSSLPCTVLTLLYQPNAYDLRSVMVSLSYARETLQDQAGFYFQPKHGGRWFDRLHPPLWLEVANQWNRRAGIRFCTKKVGTCQHNRRSATQLVSDDPAHDVSSKAQVSFSENMINAIHAVNDRAWSKRKWAIARTSYDRLNSQILLSLHNNNNVYLSQM